MSKFQDLAETLRTGSDQGASDAILDLKLMAAQYADEFAAQQQRGDQPADEARIMEATRAKYAAPSGSTAPSLSLSGAQAAALCEIAEYFVYIDERNVRFDEAGQPLVLDPDVTLSCWRAALAHLRD